MKEVIVLIGNYGSGKTELALNFAFQAANQGKKVELLDLDMVNTYFRLTDRNGLIKSKEIRLVSPNFVHSSIETLSLPAEVASAFALDWDTVIFDVGGDPAGATALGRYHEDFMALPEGSLTVLNVVNTRRPMAGTPDKLLSLMEGMQRHSRLKVDGFVNNTNLARLASAEDLRAPASPYCTPPAGRICSSSSWPRSMTRGSSASPCPSRRTCTGTGRRSPSTDSEPGQKVNSCFVPGSHDPGAGYNLFNTHQPQVNKLLKEMR